MYRNTDRELVKEIARDHYNSHRVRNRTAIFAVFLTTVLIATVCTAGAGFLSTALNAGEQTPGPMADGSLTGGKEQLEKALADPEVEWAALVRVCSSAPLHNEEFGGLTVRLYAPDPDFYRYNLVELQEGRFPQQPDEIMISDTLAQSLLESGRFDAADSVAGIIGRTFPLEVVVEEVSASGGKQPTVSKEQKEPVPREERVPQEELVPLKISGIYHNPLFSISSIYEEIYASAGFRETWNPALSKDRDIIYVKFNSLNPLLLHMDADLRLALLSETVGAESYSAGKYSGNFYSAVTFLLPVLVIVLLLMASGYFLIYNVFYISVASDIRWFGMMRTIGGTGRQIKRIMNRQVRRMACIGILSGIAAGYPVGMLAGRRIMDMTDWSIYYKNPRFLPAAALSAVFAALTVKISASRPLKIASGISPVEAARYSPKRKKGIFTVLSLALSGIIFLAVSNAALGYQVEDYVDRYNQEDYRILHKSALWELEEPYQPISGALKESLEALPFVEKADTVYMARTSDRKAGYGYYEDSTGELLPQGKLWEAIKSTADKQEIGGYYGNGIPWVNERGNVKLPIFGMPPERWDTELRNYRIVEGEYDEERFASGEYLIYNKHILDLQFSRNATKPDPASVIHANDVLKLTFYDDERKESVIKELTVMMVIEPAHEYSSSDISSAVLTLPDTLFKEIYSGYEHLIGSLQVRAREELNEEQVKEIKDRINREHNAQLYTTSRLNDYKEAHGNQVTYSLLGFFLAGILAVIGIANAVNTLTADVFAHRLEYAVMQSVGMTDRQLFRTLFLKAMKLCGAALLIMLPAGAALGGMVAEDSLFTGFNGGLFAGMAAALVLTLTVLMAALSGILLKSLTGKPLVERMRS